MHALGTNDLFSAGIGFDLLARTCSRRRFSSSPDSCSKSGDELAAFGRVIYGWETEVETVRRLRERLP